MTLFKSMPRLLRFAILMMAIAATLGVAAAAASPAHLHNDSAANSCDICRVAHTVSQRAITALQPLIAPELSYRVFNAGAAVAGYQFLTCNTSLTRGPPPTR